MKRILVCILVIVIIFAGVACNDGVTSVSLRPYNHMSNFHIRFFTVNGGAGPNASPEGGGKESCCVTIPSKWRPGLKAKVSWRYDQYSQDPNPLPPDQEVEIDLPEYRRAGTVQVHFYDNHKIKVVVSNCSPEHPFYPMSPDDLMPWTAFDTKEAMRETAKRGGGSIDC